MDLSSFKHERIYYRNILKVSEYLWENMECDSHVIILPAYREKLTVQEEIEIKVT